MMKNEEYIEISRYTYFYENTKLEEINCDSDDELDIWSEIKDRESLGDNKDVTLPFSQNIQSFWIKQYKEKYSYQTKNILGEQLFVHSLPMINNKIFIFETKVKMLFLEQEKAENAIKAIKKDRHKTFLKIIKSINPFWKGEYNVDNDHFYFINIKLDSLFMGTENIVERNKKLVEAIKNKLNFQNKCIFEQLGFTDKTYPINSRLEDDLNFVIDNEKQPLIVISPARGANKFIIPDEKLFIRCYEKDDISLPIRLVLKTLLFQKGFIEYASTTSINITEKKDKSLNETYSKLNQSFSKFIDYLWKIEISNSFYLNKSYRIIGKIWLLNPKFEILKNHINRNAIYEDKANQKDFTYIAQTIIIILSFYTIMSGVASIDQLLKSNGIIGHSLIAIIIGFIGGIFIYKVVKKLKDIKDRL